MFPKLIATSATSSSGTDSVNRTHSIDSAALERDLRAALEGEVRFDNGSRALYATDASNYRQTPIGVVIPRSIEDVVKTVNICRHHHTPILSRGGGTSLCGQCCNVAVVIDFSKYLNRIIEIDVERKFARVQPGLVLDELRGAAKKYGLTFAPDPATHSHNTLGGMLGNNSCGPHSVMGGETSDNVIELDILTYDGMRMTVGPTDDAMYMQIQREGGRRAEIYRELRALALQHSEEIKRCFPNIPRRVSGFNLPALLPENGFNLARALVGSEGTCVVILEARLRLVDWPAARSLLVLGYPSVFEAADHVPLVMKAKPIALEGIDDRLIADMKAVHIHPEDVELLPPGNGWLMVEFGGVNREESDGRAQKLMQQLREQPDAPSMKLFDDVDEEGQIWKVRESGLGATAHVPNKPITWEGWEDSSVPPEKLGEYLRALRKLFEKFGYDCDLYGHFGQGCVHTRIDFDLETAAGVRTFREFLHSAAKLVVSLGGSISGEHGDGQSKAELLPIMFGEQLMDAFRHFKSIWDPQQRMNPGKVIDAYSVDENLRLGTSYNPSTPATEFTYTDDSNNFNRAILRCVGVGECRSQSGVMCPSYQATGEEKHSTRGRARLLFEMLTGETLKGGWKEPAVKEALDLCLSCKGCKGECPVHVDMATYKAEFLSHYYADQRRPLNAYVFGLIDRWADIAAHAPGVFNFFSQQTPFATFGKRLFKIAPQRQLPKFQHSFTRNFNTSHQSGDCVVLWPDTFNNYFHPDVMQAAADVLQRGGFNVAIPRTHLCCGRPLYEHGMLKRARQYLEKILRALSDEIQKGVPIVVLEPACASVFREELPKLFPGNEQAKRLSQQIVLLSEFIELNPLAFAFEPLSHKAIVHGHCHHKAIFGMDAETAVLKRIGLNFEMLDTGCCGMAGSFGFEKDKYDVSMTCGERALLPAVRAAEDATLIIANGYSCREQIRQTTPRQPLHLAQVLQAAMHGKL